MQDWSRVLGHERERERERERDLCAVSAAFPTSRSLPEYSEDTLRKNSRDLSTRRCRWVAGLPCSPSRAVTALNCLLAGVLGVREVSCWFAQKKTVRVLSRESAKLSRPRRRTTYDVRRRTTYDDDVLCVFFRRRALLWSESRSVAIWRFLFSLKLVAKVVSRPVRTF